MDDTQQQPAKPISDDQELAKVLAGVTDKYKDMEPEKITETSVAPAASDEKKSDNDTKMPEPSTPASPAKEDTPQNEPAATTESSDLDEIKKDALTELRPLVDKLDLSPEEKFDTYLLLLRSTDDKTLIPSAHTAARDITDETRRAQALLDVIKEIDYLSAPTQPTI